MYVHGAHQGIEQRHVLNAFRTAGATAPDRAKTLLQLGLADNRVVRRLCDRQILREVKPGQFYLDDEAWRDFQSTLFKWLTALIAMLLFGFLFAILTGHR